MWINYGRSQSPADLDETRANADLIIGELQSGLYPEAFRKEYPAVSVRWEGQREQSKDSVGSLHGWIRDCNRRDVRTC